MVWSPDTGSSLGPKVTNRPCSDQCNFPHTAGGNVNHQFRSSVCYFASSHQLQITVSQADALYSYTSSPLSRASSSCVSLPFLHHHFFFLMMHHHIVIYIVYHHHQCHHICKPGFILLLVISIIKLVSH